MLRRMFAGIFLSLGTLAWGVSVGAAVASADPLVHFGKGVRAYYRHAYDEAVEHLNAAIEADSTDPRFYYFRGLSSYELGQTEQVRTDFARGAQLEAAGIRRHVGRSLERVQGEARLELERYRRQHAAHSPVSRAAAATSPSLRIAETVRTAPKPLPPVSKVLIVSEAVVNPFDVQELFVGSEQSATPPEPPVAMAPSPDVTPDEGDGHPVGTGVPSAKVAGGETEPYVFDELDRPAVGESSHHSNSAIWSVLRALGRALPRE